MSSHILVSPSVVSGQVGNVVPFVVRCPSEVHGVDLRATAQSRTARIEDTGPNGPYCMSDIRASIQFGIGRKAYGSASSGGSRPT
jgi:hypothetical protein